MFGFGFGELALIIAIGLIFLGPKRCIQAANSIGSYFGKLQRELFSIKNELTIDEDLDNPNK